MSSTGNTREETLVEVWRKLSELASIASQNIGGSYEAAAYFSGLSDAADSIYDMMSEKTRDQFLFGSEPDKEKDDDT
jgi:hypothetical protein